MKQFTWKYLKSASGCYFFHEGKIIVHLVSLDNDSIYDEAFCEKLPGQSTSGWSTDKDTGFEFSPCKKCIDRAKRWPYGAITVVTESELLEMTQDLFREINEIRKAKTAQGRSGFNSHSANALFRKPSELVDTENTQPSQPV